MRQLPTGTVTLLFTDIEGSTRLLQELGRERYVEALTTHRELLRRAFTDHGGVEVEMQGDSFHFSFEAAREAVCAAAAGQRALSSYDWPSEPIRVRIGVHTGEPVVADHLYAGLDVHRAARVMSAAHGGQVLLSHRTADLIADEPPDDLVLRDLGEHRLKDLLEPQRLYQLEGDGLEHEFAPLKTLAATITNLPVQPTPLIGRDRELAELGEVLSGGARIVTLTGPGGTGKTRLALQVAAELAGRFPDGVFWVSLAAVREPELVLPTVEQAIGSKVPLAEHVGQKRLLVLLDNLEQVIDAASDLAALASRCPNLHLLSTSRAPLRIRGEAEYGVEPLVEEQAVALFHERAQQHEPADAVREICRRLDHLPLAIELAAARTRLLPPTELLARLEERLPLLATGSRDAPERQRALRATIAWSYELLAAEHQDLFRRLSVFAGSFEVEAAEAVCGADLFDLEVLLEQSLLRRWGSGRLGMLETIREFATAELERAGRAHELREQHARYYTELTARGEPELRGPDQARWLGLFRAETDNLRSALDFLAAAEDREPEARLAASCWYFWYLSGMIREGVSRLSSARRDEQLLPADARAGVLEGAAALRSMLGDVEEAAEAADEAIRIRRDLGEPAGLLRALLNRAVAAQGAADLETSNAMLDECAELARSVGDEWFLAIALTNRALDLVPSRDFHRARELLEEAVTRLEGRDPLMLVPVEANLAWIDLELGATDSAQRRFVSALDRSRAASYPEAIPWCLDGLAAVEARSGDAARAARLLGAGEAVAAEYGYTLPPFEAEWFERVSAMVEERLGPELANAERATGRSLDLDAAVAYGLEEPRD